MDRRKNRESNRNYMYRTNKIFTDTNVLKIMLYYFQL